MLRLPPRPESHVLATATASRPGLARRLAAVGHLVFVDAIVPERMPALSEVEPQVKADWLEAQTRVLKDKALMDIRSRYSIILPELNAETINALLSGPQAIPAQGEP